MRCDLYPVGIKLPGEGAALVKPGAQASVTVFTDEDKPINVPAEVLQYVAAWMNVIF